MKLDLVVLKVGSVRSVSISIAAAVGPSLRDFEGVNSGRVDSGVGLDVGNARTSPMQDSPLPGNERLHYAAR